jgi:hypothetical protein
MAINRNRACNIHKFYQAFLANVITPNEKAVMPLLCLTGCSPALESGALLAFSADDMTKTQIEYSNRVLIHLLYYTKVMADIKMAPQPQLQREAGFPILEAFRQKVSIFLKECKSHVYQAPPNWMRKHKSTEFTHSRGHFKSLLKCVFLSILEENCISDAIVQLSIVIAMLETETFVAPPFNNGMPTQDHQGPAELETELHLTREINVFILKRV